MIEGLPALYIFMLSAFTGYEVISRVPVILHTPLMSGSNFVHGIVLVGAMIVMGEAEGALMQWVVMWRPSVCWKCSSTSPSHQVPERKERNNELQYY